MVEVLINDYPIDFELEGEKTIPEIVSSISGWARERGLIFIELFINDKLYTLEELKGKDFKNADMINCIIESKSNLVFSTVDEGAFYCNKVVDFVNCIGEKPSFDMKDIENLGSGIDWLSEVLKQIAHLMDLDTGGFKFKDKTFQDFVDKLKEMGARLPGLKGNVDIAAYLTEHKSLFLELKELFRLILTSNDMKDLILKSIDSPDVLMTTLHTLRGELPQIAKNIEEAAISFQSGRDSSGMDKLNEFIDFMLMYTRTCYQVVPVFGINPSEIEDKGITLEDKNSRIMELLNDVIAAMENNDVVSLADILEYEIMPLTEGLDYFIDTLIKKIDNK